MGLPPGHASSCGTRFALGVRGETGRLRMVQDIKAGDETPPAAEEVTESRDPDCTRTETVTRLPSAHRPVEGGVNTQRSRTTLAKRTRIRSGGFSSVARWRSPRRHESSILLAILAQAGFNAAGKRWLPRMQPLTKQSWQRSCKLSWRTSCPASIFESGSTCGMRAESVGRASRGGSLLAARPRPRHHRHHRHRRHAAARRPVLALPQRRQPSCRRVPSEAVRSRPVPSFLCLDVAKTVLRTPQKTRATIEQAYGFAGQRGCARGDSNPHALIGHQDLNLARLPFRHSRSPSG
jgi:hypothetical protein